MKRRRTEQQAQAALFQHIKLRGRPGLVAAHVPNGGYRRPIEARIMKGLGVAKGMPDVLLWFCGASYAIELKSETGRVTPDQQDMLARLDAAGVYVALCRGLDEALAQLERWQLLRGSVQ